MKNRILLTLISLLLVVSFVIPLASCDLLGMVDGGDESESSDEAGGEESKEAPKKEADVVLYDKGVTGYAIVYPQNPDTELRAAALALRNAIEDITGEDVTFVADNSSKVSKTGKKQICIGKTNRAVTEKAIARFDGKVGYRYDYIDGCMTIIGNSDHLTTIAVKAALEEILTVDGTKVSVSSELSEFVDMSDKMVSLIIDDPKEAGAKTFAYKMVIQNGDNDIRQASTNFAKEIETLLNTGKDKADRINISCKYDINSPREEGQLEIIVGNTNRNESTSIYNDLGYFSYRVTEKNDNIIVAARLKDYVVKGLNGLRDYIRSAYASSIDGNCYIPTGIELGDELLGWTNEVPNLKTGTYEGIYDSGDGSYLVRYSGVTQSNYNAYIETFTKEGFTKLATYDLGGNIYNLMKGKQSAAYVIYNKASSEVRVSYDKAGYNYPTVSKAGAEGKYTPTLWQLRVDNYGSRENGGMSYVLQLSNGHFIIIDGGYNTEEEADHLYKFLKMKAPTGETPVIEAWFISHLHGDHFGAFLKFTDKYVNQGIELQGVYYNFLKSDVIPLGSIKPIQDAAKRWTGCVLYEKVRTGMTIKFTGLDVDIITTHEDLYPLIAWGYEGNDTTTVFKFTVTSGGKKQSIMFLGDCFPNECTRILENFKSSGILKCDIVQWSHHGYEGATKAVYEAIGAHTVLWPMNIIGWQVSGATSNPHKVFVNWFDKNLDGFCGNYMVSNTTVKNVIIAGYAEHTFCNACDGRNSGGACGAYQELVLPYTPKNIGGLTGQALVNYYKNLANQYYDAHKNDRVPYNPHNPELTA